MTVLGVRTVDGDVNPSRFVTCVSRNVASSPQARNSLGGGFLVVDRTLTPRCRADPETRTCARP